MTTASTCRSCGGEIALWAAKPRITADGTVEVECASCASGLRPTVVATVPEPDPPPPRRRRVRALVTSAVTVTTIAGLALFSASSTQRPRDAQAAAQPAAATPKPRPQNWQEVVPPVETVAPTTEIAEEATEEPTPELPPMPERDGEPYDEWFPTLRDWVHPVPGTTNVVPTKATRRFGATRENHPHIREECGGGHCGVDLEGDRGQPVVAVAWGTVVRVQNDPDRLGGRYVRIEHPDFVYTSYFHLDRIARGLKVGDEVEPGTVIGALGRTGIEVSMAHLHFALELPDEASRHVEFVDPVPYLARATVLARDAVAEVESEAEADPEAE